MSIKIELIWNINVPSWAMIITFFSLIPPSSNDSKENEFIEQMSDKGYEELEIKYDQFFYKLGLFGFIVSSLTSWVYFYGELVSGI